MKIFNYQAIDQEGKRVKGQIEASEKKQALAILKERNYTPYSLEEKREFFLKIFWEKLTQRITTSDLAIFTRQLSTMINAGLSLTESLALLKSQSKPVFGLVIEDIQRKIESGSSFADALQTHPKIFSPVYVALVRAGETAGVLDTVLLRLADNLEGQHEFKTKLKGAMIYPIVILAGMILVAGGMMIFVVPKLLGLYKEMSAELPAPTKILISLSNFAVRFWWIVLAIFAGFGYLLKVVYTNPEGRKKIDGLKFKLPIVGKLVLHANLAELTRTLSLLIGTGVSITEGLEVVAKVSGNKILEESVRQAGVEVKKGSSLSEALAKSFVFPRMVVQMVAVGEETGKLDDVLMKVSRYFQSQSEESLKGLTTALEPLIIVLLGVGVGFLIIAVILPIYNLTSQIK